MHDALIASALGPKNPDIAALQTASRNFDSWSQLNSMASWHAMRSPEQSVESDKADTERFIGIAMSNAGILEAAGNHQGAMKSLAMAMHAVMDATSPAHRNAKGEPVPWNLWDGRGAWRAHGAAEGGQPTAEQRRALNAKLRAMYDQVMARARTQK